MQDLLSQQDIKTVCPLSILMIFEDNHNWDVFSLVNKDILRDVEIKEIKKMISCKDENRGFFNCRKALISSTSAIFAHLSVLYSSLQYTLKIMV